MHRPLSPASVRAQPSRVSHSDPPRSTRTEAAERGARGGDDKPKVLRSANSFDRANDVDRRRREVLRLMGDRGASRSGGGF